MVRQWRFHVSAGILCLDFANTVSWRRSEAPIDRIKSAADLFSWARQAGAITAASERRLAREALANPRQAARLLAEARALRETVFEVFAARSEGRAPGNRDLLHLQRWIRVALGHSRLTGFAGSYRWQLESDSELQSVLWMVALSVESLLRSAELGFIGQCDGRDCRWLWIDRTRNHSRRWCDMAVCGNRAKAQRHHKRMLRAS
jgi:predicted RNA-binding Zn ribbon-like protein